MPRSNKPELDILSVPWKATGIACIIFSASLVAWASFTKIPRKVTGQGVYYSIGDTSSFITKEYGKVHIFVNKYQSNIAGLNRINQLLPNVRASMVSTTDISYVIKTAESLMQELNAIESTDNNGEIWSGKVVNELPLKVRPDNLLVYAESSEKKSALLESIGVRNALKMQLTQQKEKNKLLKNTLLANLDQRALFQKDVDKLVSINFISKLAGLENQAEINNLKSQINSLNTELREIETDLDKAGADVKTKFYDFVTNTMLFSNESIFVQQISTPDSDYMSPGSLILSYSKKNINDPDRVPVFFSAKDVATLNDNDSALVSLPGYPKSMYGGINANVVKRENLSVIPKQMQSYLGLSGFSDFLEYNFISPTMVTVKLETNKNGKVKWTTNSPNINSPRLRIGDKINVEVVIGTITPIEMIIPTLSRIFGITPPEIKEAKPKSEQGK